MGTFTELIAESHKSKFTVGEVSEYKDKTKADQQEYEKTLHCTLNPYENGGESLRVIVDVFSVKGETKEAKYTNVHIDTQCYGVHSNRLTLWTIGLSELIEGLLKIREKI